MKPASDELDVGVPSWPDAVTGLGLREGAPARHPRRRGVGAWRCPQRGAYEPHLLHNSTSKENHVSISNLTPESYHPSNRITSSPEVLTHSLAESVTNTSSRDSRYSSFSSAQSQFPNPSAFLKELELPRISLERSRPESAPSGTS